MNFNFVSTFLALSVAAASCGPISDDSNTLSGLEGTFEIVTGSNNTFLKKSLDVDTKNEEGRGKEFCTLYAFNRYQLYAAPVEEGKHLKVNIVDFTAKGCSFSSGYVYTEHLSSTSAPAVSAPASLDSVAVVPAKASGPKIVNFLGKQVVIGAVRNSSLSAKEKAFLDMIAAAEGTSNTLSSCGKNDDGYKSIFGCDHNSSRIFYNYGYHPAKAFATGWGTYSDASGRYQFKSTTWNELAGKHGLADFSPSSQDKGAILKIKERGSNPNSIVNYSSFDNAVYGVRLEWASMPHSPYGQKTYGVKPLYDLYLKALELY